MIDKLRGYMKKNNWDSFYVTKKVNVRYISNYKGDDSFLFITQDAKYIITDKRYTEQASIECPDYEIVVWRTTGNTMADTIAYLAEKNHVSNIAFEGDLVSFNQYSQIKEKLAIDMIATSEVIEDMRIIKTPEEVQKLRMACDIASRAFERILTDIQVGVTEKELAAKLSAYMVFEGADSHPYGNILISGARTSLLHGIPSTKAIEYGDFVLMDFGCQIDGYMSDMTRTVVVGKATPMQKEVYQLEKQMVEDSLEVMKAGVSVRDVYLASIKAIKDTKYFEYHYANIGHGIGLFVHEKPMMTEFLDDILQEGNVRTIEPGLYIPGWGGVRIEDQVLITTDGYENMISSTRELIEL